jgi:dihydrofolate reductase
MISMICAVGKNLAIGRDNKLIWNLPNDLKHFRDITKGHTVVMGDRTFESIGRPLPNRKNIVVTLQENYQALGCEVRNSLEEVLGEYKNIEEEIFVIGGATIYKLSLPFVDKLYLTLVDDAPDDADAFFPDYAEFKKEISREEHEETGIKYAFVELIK